MPLDFFQTVMGRKFYEHDVPQIANSLQSIATSMKKAEKKTEIVVVVEGGCVQTVFSTNPDIKVELLDWDESKVDEESKDLNKELFDSINDRKMTEVPLA